MKKKELVENVRAWTKDDTPDTVDEQRLAIDLMTAGASMSLVSRELGKCLIALKLKVDPNIERKAAESTVKSEFDNDKNFIRNNFEDSQDVATWCDDMATSEHSSEALMKALKKYVKANKLELPKKPQLGQVKTGILNYFNDFDLEETSINDLAEYLAKGGYCKETKTETVEEAALRAARMNYSFSVALLRNHVALG